METEQPNDQANRKPQRTWIRSVLIVLVAEKVVQHVVVTLALTFNWRDIRSTVAVDPRLLMVLGAIVGILFAVSLWGILARKRWARSLVIGLCVFDIVGEFVAQGTLGIAVTVSFLVASILLVLALVYRREEPSKG